MTDQDCLQQFTNFLTDQVEVKTNARLLLAVSGGVDSMVMVDLVARGRWDFGIAHCNFQLRGDDSESDAKLVSDVAKARQVPLHSERFDPITLAKQKGISLQMAARDLRYEWLERIRGELGYDWIATAHQLNDQAETILLNLAKGTGIRGMHGILPKIGHTIRPLLFAEKAQLIAYARDRQLNWREDASNQTDDYQRNYLRHHVIPALQTINPAFFQTMQKNVQRFTAVEELWKRAFEKLWDESATAYGEGWSLDKRYLIDLEYPGIYLYELLAPFGFNQSQANILADQINKEPGKCLYSPDYTLEIGRQVLLLYPRSENERSQNWVAIDEGQKSVEFEGIRVNLSQQRKVPMSECKAANILCVDASMVEYPLILRHWQEGDAFYPFGMTEPKKLSDFFVDEKFSRYEKAKTLILESNGKIMWIVGVRADNRFRVTLNTQQVLKITAEKA